MTGWLDDIPGTWSRHPAWAVFQERSERSMPGDQHLTPSQTYGVLPQAEYMAITGNRVVLNLTGADNMKAVREGDFIIHLRSFQGGIEASDIDGKVSNAYTVLKPASPFVRGYFRHLLKANIFIEQLVNLTDQLRDGQSINYARFSRLRLPVPPIDTQRRIADFLDRETAEIDAMDAELDHAVEGLEERAAAVASMLTFGGPEYGLAIDQGRVIGRFPAEWNSTRFDIAFPSTDERNGTSPLGPMLSVSEYRGIEPRRYGEREAARPLDEVAHYRVVRPGQVVANIMWLNHSGIGVSEHLGYTSPDYRVYSVREDILPRYAHHLLRSAAYRDAFSAIGEGVRPNAQRANTTLLGMLPVPVPSLEEQRRIVAELDEETALIEDMIADAQHLKALLAERRSTLITEVVTGRKEVA